MSSNKQEFLKHLDDSRRDVEKWPEWKQEGLKASTKEDSSKLSSNSGKIYQRTRNS